MVINFKFIALVSFLIGLCSAQDFWKQTLGPEGGSFKKLVEDNKNNLYAISYEGNIFKSSDGTNWKHVFTELSNINDLKFYKNEIYACLYNKLLTSSDDGQSWQDISPTGYLYTFYSILVTDNELILGGYKSIFIYKNNWQILVDSLYSNVIDMEKDSKGTLYAATDGIGLLKINNGHFQRLFSQEHYIKDLKITTADIFYVASDNGLYKSEDKGASWYRIDPNLNKDNFNSLVINNNTIYTSAEYGGVFLFENGLFKDITYNLPTNQVMSVFKNKQGSLYAATMFHGLFRLKEYSQQWQEVNTGLIASTCHKLSINSNDDIYVTTYKDGIIKSENYGITWKQLNIDNYMKDYIYDIEISGNSDIYFTAGYLGVYFSDNDGSSWQEIGDGITYASRIKLNTATDEIYLTGYEWQGYIYKSERQNINWQLLQSPTSAEFENMQVSKDGKVYLISQFSEMFQYDPLTNIWEEISYRNSVEGNISAFAISPENTIFLSTNQAVYKSTDEGKSWISLNSGMKYPYWDSFIFVDSNTIFAVDWGTGIFASYDTGMTWSMLNSGLTSVRISNGAINRNGVIFLATAGSGVYASSKSLYGNELPDFSPTTYTLYQSNPNPFNNTAEIPIETSKSSLVKISIYDRQGCLIKILYNGIIDGTKIIEWNGTNNLNNKVASGIYFYTLTVKNYIIDSKKMIYIR